MDKKASILTFHCVPNYGAVLQTYAMQEYLKKHYDRVEVVDYRPESLLAEYRYLSFYSIYSLGATLWSLLPFWRKCRKFRAFEKKYLNLASSEKVSTDLLILGSDQIWNPQITRGPDPAYFGQLDYDEKPVVVSYAASVGKATLAEEEKTVFQNALKNIDRISVREEEARELLMPLTEKPISVTSDPTILAGAECFLPHIRAPKYKDYILLYSLNGYKETEDLAQKISKYFEKPLVELSGRRKGIVPKNHKLLYSAGPEEFLSLIADADYVITDSFHGTVFSLLFHKQFVAIPHKTRNGRLKGLLECCGLQERLITTFRRQVVDTEPNWEVVDAKIADLRERSEMFLKEAEVGNA